MIVSSHSRKIALTTSSRAVADYRKVLLNDWSAASLDATASLIERCLKASGLKLRFPWQPGRKATKQDFVIDDALVRELVEHIFPTFEPFAIPPPDARTINISRWDQTALRCLVEMLVQLRVRFEGASQYLRDLQSALFLQVLFELLPRLKKEKRLMEHDALVAALLYHANQMWVDEDGHRLYLISEVAHYLGLTALEDEVLYQSFMLTPPDDHSYMTAVQQYWSFLLDHRRYDRAKEFLLQAFSRGSADVAEEIRQMMDRTYTSLLAE